MSYEKYYEGRTQMDIDYPLDLKAIVNENIYPLMEKLKANGFHIGMASSSPRDKVLQNLDTLGLTDYFEIIVSGLDFKRSSSAGGSRPFLGNLPSGWRWKYAYGVDRAQRTAHQNTFYQYG